MPYISTGTTMTLGGLASIEAGQFQYSCERLTLGVRICKRDRSISTKLFIPHEDIEKVIDLLVTEAIRNKEYAV